jgi:glucose-1-phosphate thymidylyltransferase
LSPTEGDLVGLVPAAGRALRLADAPGVTAAGTSKEVLPVGGPGGPSGKPRPAAAHLLSAFARAGGDRAYVVLREGKWDVPEALVASTPESLLLAYLVLRESSSVAETLDAAYPFVRGRRVALGFPDILFRPADAFLKVRERQEATGADAVLGLVPTDRPEKADVVVADADGRVREIVIKPPMQPARPEGVPAFTAFTWIAAVWGPAITERLHDEVAAVRRAAEEGAVPERELYPGDVLARAAADGLRIEAVTFPEGMHLDIGTPDDLHRARNWR